MKANENFDVSAELDRRFGAVGTETRKQAVNQAWEEYSAQVLIDARKSVNMTQKELAERIGSDKSYISRIEKGLITPTVGTLYKMASAMGFRVELTPM